MARTRSGADAVAERARGLTAAEFRRLMTPLGPFEPGPHLAVAVSGGRDSLALTLLADAWTKSRGGRLTGLIVDHRLRPESGAEARRTRGWLRSRGIPAKILAWEGEKPKGDMQAAARAARYRLLEAWCRQNAVLHLLLAQQREDQAETLLLRLGRGSGLTGLACMPSVKERTDVRVLRPLLYVPRARLTATLEAAGQDWIDDPGNLDPVRARARLRAALPGLIDDRQTVERLARTARELGRARAALDLALAVWAAEIVRVHPSGFVSLELAGLRRTPDELRLRLLAGALAGVGGAEFPPRATDLARLWREVGRGGGRARTLGGCVIDVRKGELRVMREPAAVGASVALARAGQCRWDGRFTVAAGRSCPGRLTLRALGATPAAFSRASPPKMVQKTLAAIWSGGRLAAVPQLGLAEGAAGRRAAGALQVFFAPPRALAPAAFGIV